MPFYPPYKEMFIPNDLIYGLTKIRSRYRTHVAAFKNARPDIPWFIDDFSVTGPEREENKGLAEYLGEDDIMVRQEKNLVNHIRAHPKYHSIYDAQPFSVGVLKKQGAFACIRAPHVSQAKVYNPHHLRKKCKAGLSWAAASHRNELGFSVHFLLDELNIREVVLKTNSQDSNYQSFYHFLLSGLEKYRLENTPKRNFRYESRYDELSMKRRALTGSELRWLYRNRHDVNVQQAIQFWYGNQPCCPPWDPNFDLACGQKVVHLWTLYQPRSQIL
jgi:hypothetical protein